MQQGWFLAQSVPKAHSTVTVRFTLLGLLGLARFLWLDFTSPPGVPAAQARGSPASQVFSLPKNALFHVELWGSRKLTYVPLRRHGVPVPGCLQGPDATARSAAPPPGPPAPAPCSAALQCGQLHLKISVSIRPAHTHMCVRECTCTLSSSLHASLTLVFPRTGGAGGQWASRGPRAGAGETERGLRSDGRKGMLGYGQGVLGSDLGGILRARGAEAGGAGVAQDDLVRS